LTPVFFPGLYKHTDLRILKLGRTNNLLAADSLIDIIKHLPKLQVLEVTRCPKLPKDIRDIPGLSFLIWNTLVCSQ